MIRLKWSDYFFNSFEEFDFKIYRTIIFLYIFFLIGFDDIYNSSELQKLWQPISFFQLFNYSALVIISGVSFYTIKIFSLMASLNIWYQISSKCCFISMIFNLGFYSNFGKVFHGYQFLIITIGLLSLVSSPNKKENLWPLQLIKIYGASIYFIAAINKILTSGLDWVFSENLYRQLAHIPGKTWGARQLLESNPIICIILSFCVIFLFQLPAILAPFYKLAGVYLFIGAFAFHGGVSLILGGHYAFLSHLFCLLIYIRLDLIKKLF